MSSIKVKPHDLLLFSLDIKRRKLFDFFFLFTSIALYKHLLSNMFGYWLVHVKGCADIGFFFPFY